MSLRAPSVITLVGLLQQKGLTYAQLAAFVAACQAHHTGPVLFNLAQGRIRSVQVESRLARLPRVLHD